MNRPKFQRGELVGFVGRHVKIRYFYVTDYFYDKKNSEYKYLLQGKYHQYATPEKLEHKLIKV